MGEIKGAPACVDGIKIGPASNAVMGSYEEQVIPAMGGAITAGGAKVVKVGCTVTITGDQIWTHASSNAALSAVGIVDPQFRPSTPIFGCYLVSSGVVCRMNINPDGSVQVRYFDASLADLSRSDTTTVPTITYNII